MKPEEIGNLITDIEAKRRKAWESRMKRANEVRAPYKKAYLNEMARINKIDDDAEREPLAKKAKAELTKAIPIVKAAVKDLEAEAAELHKQILDIMANHNHIVFKGR